MMGGEIIVQSELGKGSKFSIYLPVDCEIAAKKLSSFKSQPSLDPQSQLNMDNGKVTTPSILVIDDDPMVHQYTKAHLQHYGIAIHSAFSGKDGINLAHEVLPNAIVLDVQMPSMSGWEVLKELKSQLLTSSIPIILLTINEDHQYGSYEIGANDYLFKPIDRDRLIPTIEKYRSISLNLVDKSEECSVNNLPLSVLIIEDDVPVRSMLKRMLEKENCIVFEAQDGQEALERINANMPQLILLDLMMPNIDGFEFIHLLRLRYDTPSIPIIIITARDLSDTDYNRLSGSVQKILQKTNFSYGQLLEEIMDRLEKFGILTSRK
jgi:CheY-like chemotaxis protein